MDPKYSMWISTDPALGDYIPKAPINEEAKKHNQNLPGMGGVFNHINGDLYAYAGNNPVKYTDPDGKLFCLVTAGVGAGIGLIYGAYKVYKEYDETHTVDWKKAALEIGKDALIGGAIGLCGGAIVSYAFTGSAASSTLSVCAGAHLKLAAIGTAGYETFQKFKDSVGRAGDGKAWHHIVEQNPSNISRFGPKAIHNLNNIVKISHGKETLHQMITNFYNAKAEFTGGLTVREWLSTQSYEEQWKFGLQKLTEFAKKIGAKIEFVE